MSQPSSKSFKALKATWYKKLKDSGFKDAEDKNHELIRHSSSFYAKNSYYSLEAVALRIKAKTAYYRMASHFLHDFTFENNLDKSVWTLHAEGGSTREIARKLNKKSHTTIFFIIKALRTKMFEMYSEKKHE